MREQLGDHPGWTGLPLSGVLVVPIIAIPEVLVFAGMVGIGTPDATYRISIPYPDPMSPSVSSPPIAIAAPTPCHGAQSSLPPTR